MDTDIAVFDKVIAINARGALLVTKYASASMIRLGKGGSIVNVSSQASLVALRGHISYGSSKAALDNITRVSALELGRHGIRVNSVNPTVIMTPMSAWYWGKPEIADPFLATMPLGRWATEDEIAASVSVLQRAGAQFVLLQCQSTYPAPYKDVHLRYMDRLAELGERLHFAAGAFSADATEADYHAHRIAQRPWAEDCAHEISRWASTIQTMTTPPPTKLLADYTPEQRREGMTHAKGTSH